MVRERRGREWLIAESTAAGHRGKADAVSGGGGPGSRQRDAHALAVAIAKENAGEVIAA